MKTINVPAVKGFEEIEKFHSDKVDVLNWPKDYPYAPKVDFSIAHTDGSLLVEFRVSENNVKAVCLDLNGPVWEDSCAEIFLQVPGSEFYYNFETNCIGVGLAAKRRSRTDSMHFSSEKIGLIKRTSSLPCEPIDKVGEGLEWTLRVEIPFSLIGLDGCPKRLNANFYKCGDKTATMHFLSWNPIDVPTPDFHRPDYFGELILCD